jgi:hypothetical protein
MMKKAAGGKFGKRTRGSLKRGRQRSSRNVEEDTTRSWT